MHSSVQTRPTPLWHHPRLHTLWPQLLGAVAVLIFSLTIPMTRLAGGTVTEPALSPWFVALGRSALAGLLAAVYLAAVRAPRPTLHQWRALLGLALGGVFTFPLCMGWAVRHVPAAHAAVVTGVLPLTTAALAAWWMGRSPGLRFWLGGALGCALVLSYAWWKGYSVGAGGWVAADGWLVLAMFGASSSYVLGAQLSQQLAPAHVISWVMVGVLPVTVPAALWCWPDVGVPVASWCALGYLSVFSSWLGFFAWYAALARDPMRVSQIQLMQPFLAMTLAVPLLGEPLDGGAILAALSVLAVVVITQRKR